ncbi:MAG: Excinuclease ABC, C subunit domain protein [Parcubacteria group bacterium GW2011_GWA2_42_11]|nr:MAG: Excinuclease ABC, C subunit domain protein [Parcubacteria group bacterium GW2011_GWA2_42_11]KKT76620.1 MAG: Excinuclease ABC, C subunit domain protein [Parcubacteria group bacterium GW2011_GWF2_44_7]
MVKFVNKANIINKIKKLPKSPGVYIFKNKNRAVLYVGKATNLRDRVRSYFFFTSKKVSSFGRPVDYAIGQIADIKVIRTDTVLEAYILEQDLIKKFQPKYNAMGRDDKSFSYVVLAKEKWPRFLILRKTELSKFPNKKIQNTKHQIQFARIFGPYTSKKQIEIALKILRKIFPYHSKPQKSEKGCLDFQIGLCPGPHDGKISRADYLKNIRGIIMILKGKKKGLIKKLEMEMKDYSKICEYEKAAEIRNKIFALKHIRDIALIAKDDDKSRILSAGWRTEFRIEAYDISNISGQYAVGSMIVFEGEESKRSEYRKFRIKNIQGVDDIGMMREVLNRRFHNSWPKPDLLLLDGGLGHLHMAERLLRRLNLNIVLVAVAKGPERKKLEINYNANLQINTDPRIANIINNRNLIKQIMDEAHRFAITYHKKVRRREFISC